MMEEKKNKRTKNFGNNLRKRCKRGRNKQEFEGGRIKEWDEDKMGNLQNPYNEL